MSQLAFGSTGMDQARLVCGHAVPFDRKLARRTADDWYAAVWCPECRRAHAVVLVKFR